jgi:hypothetical protein
MSILHVMNGDCSRVLLEPSGVPGTVLVWPDVLHDGPTPLVSGEEWIQARAGFLEEYFDPDGDGAPEASRDFGSEYRAREAVLDSYAKYDELVFWLEHDLFDQLLLIRHLWWLRGKTGPKFSLVCGNQYLGLLKREAYPALFEARTTITANQIAVGARAWEAFCAPDPTGLLRVAAAEDPELPYLPAAIRRHLEEFPSLANGLSRSERQLLEVLAEGARTPDEAFIQASRLEEDIFMGDLSFGAIIRRLAGGPRPLVAAQVTPRPGRLPSGTLALTADGAAVLAGHADQIALNGIDRWLGGVRLTGGPGTGPVGGSRAAPSSERVWRWDGVTLVND